MSLVNQYFDDVLGDGKHSLLDDIIHPALLPFKKNQGIKTVDLDLVNKDFLKLTGIEGIKFRIKIISEQFGDFNFDKMEVVETKETVVVHYKVTMTHIGTWNHIPATGAKIETQGFHLFKFKDDKIFSITAMLNLTDILSQLGDSIINEKDALPDYLETIRKLLKL